MVISYRKIRDRLAQSAFRSRFRPTDRDRRFIAEKSWPVLLGEARHLVRARLAPAVIPNDGRQTPMRGHVLFLAQHATGCCCRGCLEKWYGIPRGRALTEEEISAIADILMDFLQDQCGDLRNYPHTPDLWET